MSIKKYSSRAREKFADHLFSLASSLATGMVTVILVAPLGVVLSALFQPGDEGVGFLKAMLEISPLEYVFFVLLYLVVLGLIMVARKSAMQIYTELYPDS